MHTKGCPQTIRADRGTENCKVAECQIALRMFHTDTFAQEKSFQYGTSPSNSVKNIFSIIILYLSSLTDILCRVTSFQLFKITLLQRIESWWSRLRRQKSDWWIQHFRVSCLILCMIPKIFPAYESFYKYSLATFICLFKALERDGWFDAGSVIHKLVLLHT